MNSVKSPSLQNPPLISSIPSILTKSSAKLNKNHRNQAKCASQQQSNTNVGVTAKASCQLAVIVQAAMMRDTAHGSKSSTSRGTTSVASVALVVPVKVAERGLRLKERSHAAR